MSDFPQIGKPTQLLIKHLLDRTLTWAPDHKIIYRDEVELTYRDFHARVQRLGNVLISLGVKQGDRVGVLDWDSHRYLELFFAVPMIGAVLHTINARLTPAQTGYTIDHAQDKVIFIGHEFVELLSALLPQLPSVKHVVMLSAKGGLEASEKKESHRIKISGDYETLLAAAEPIREFPDFDENLVATMMYTTGTTGDPKGVFFTHRQLVLHTLCVGFTVTGFPNPFGLDSKDVYMPLTPMFHVHAWGIPYLATTMGLKQVYPGRYEPRLLRELITRHKVTFTHCVPTMLQMLVHSPPGETDLNGLKLLVGGAALPKGLAREATKRGIQVIGGYGLSETCPVIAVSQLLPGSEELNGEEQLEFTTRSGFPIPFARAQAIDTTGQVLPPGKENTGEIVLQSPWLTTGYFKQNEQSRVLWRSGWLHTGDVGYIDERGYIRITDRLKDVIKIGGEWISTLELENALSQHSAVKEAAVVGVPDPKWDERPFALVVLRPEKKDEVTAKELQHFLHTCIDRGTIHKRAILTEVRIVDEIPKTGVGKVDKRVVRAKFKSEAP